MATPDIFHTDKPFYRPKCWVGGHDYGEDSVDPSDPLGICPRHLRELKASNEGSLIDIFDETG